MTANRPWLPVWEVALQELKARGMFHKDIAVELSRRFPEKEFTLGAVDHKVTALRKQSVKAKTETRGRAVVASSPVAGETVEKPQPDSPVIGKPISEIGQWECRYEITGTKNKKAYRFCGKPVVKEPPYSYCHEHSMICYSGE